MARRATQPKTAADARAHDDVAFLAGLNCGDVLPEEHPAYHSGSSAFRHSFLQGYGFDRQFHRAKHSELHRQQCEDAPLVMIGRKFITRPAKGGRRKGSLNIYWSESPYEVGLFYTSHKAYFENKSEAARATYAEYFDGKPYLGRIDKLVKRLDTWAALEWNEDKEDAWRARWYDKQ